MLKKITFHHRLTPRRYTESSADEIETAPIDAVAWLFFDIGGRKDSPKFRQPYHSISFSKMTIAQPQLPGFVRNSISEKLKK